MKTILKLLSVLAMVAGAIYVLATYGDKIVAWAKKLIVEVPCDREGTFFVSEETPVSVPAEEAAPAEETVPVEEVPGEEVPVEEPVEVHEEVPAENAPAAPVADEADFEG